MRITLDTIGKMNWPMDRQGRPMYPEGFEDLVKSCYPLLRDFILSYPLVLPGTDIFQAGGWSVKAVGDGPYLDQYDIRLNSSAGEVSAFWDILYHEIGRTNAVIERSEDITYVDPAKKAARVPAIKVLPTPPLPETAIFIILCLPSHY